MKSILNVFLFVFLFSSFSISQENAKTYDILSVGDKYTKAQITEALDAAELCGFYYINEKRELLFDDGSTVKLDSSNENNSLSDECFINKSSAHKDEYWEISANGHLIRRKQTLGK